MYYNSFEPRSMFSFSGLHKRFIVSVDKKICSDVNVAGSES